jgi:hypothetical protein
MGILGNPDFDDMTPDQMREMAKRLPEGSPLRDHFESVANFVEHPSTDNHE